VSEPTLPPVRPSGLCSVCFHPRIVGRPLISSYRRCECRAENPPPLEGAALARHLGFGDGLRFTLGKMPVDLEHPVSLQFPDAYFEGLGTGKASGLTFIKGSRPLTLVPTLWDSFKSFFRWKS